ncbi:MAG: PRC-barrel domain-containing protein [Anaerolineales bacterium]
MHNNLVLSASTLIGDDVVNLAGENLGELEEIMLDVGTGQVAYAVLSFGGFLGMGDKLFAIPWEALQVDTEKEAFILDLAREDLENAPGFDKDDWPSTIERDFLIEIHQFYGYKPYWE